MNDFYDIDKNNYDEDLWNHNDFPVFNGEVPEEYKYYKRISDKIKNKHDDREWD